MFSKETNSEELSQMEHQYKILSETLYSGIRELANVRNIQGTGEYLEDLFQSLKALEADSASKLETLRSAIAEYKLKNHSHIVSGAKVLYKVSLEAIFEEEAEGVSMKATVGPTDSDDPVKNVLVIEQNKFSGEFVARLTVTVVERVRRPVELSEEFGEKLREKILSNVEFEIPDEHGGVRIYFESSKNLQSSLSELLLVEIFKQLG